jgi:hypothetical protein
VHRAAEPYLRQPPTQLCCAKIILLPQTGICRIFLIHFYCAGSHTEHRWRCFKMNEKFQSPLFSPF